MTRTPTPLFVLTSILCTGAGSVFAQQPPDVVQSDANQNTAVGSNALISQAAIFGPGGPFNNTAVGFDSLTSDGTGANNTATGVKSLASNTYGSANTANGSFALSQNTTGNNNSAFGISALQYTTTGAENTGLGASALFYNTVGANNTASGASALYSNTSGSENTADGFDALFSNTTGINNVAAGFDALYGNTTGQYNVAIGSGTLGGNSIGSGNTAIGVGALDSNTVGGNNIALGAYAGADITSGWRNIDIGNVGAKADAGTIRIGTSGQHLATYVAGINGVHLSGSAVYISSSGQLGVLASSERYKTSIKPMAQRTEKLKQLRPVTFHLKTDPKGDIQYGLIAEEVAKVYPELVIRDESGRIEGVRYEELAPMLLNEIQTQQQTLEAMQSRLEQIERSMQGRAAERQ